MRSIYEYGPSTESPESSEIDVTVTSLDTTPYKVLKAKIPPNHTLSGAKFDEGKARFDLLPFEALEEVAKVMAFGATKYQDHNWRGGFIFSRPAAAALRHLTSWLRGEENDPESGLSHLAHCACCVLFLLTFVKTETGRDDRYIYPSRKAGTPQGGGSQGPASASR